MKEEKEVVKEVRKRKLVLRGVRKYVVVFLLKEHGTYSLLGKRRVRPTDKIVRFRKGFSYKLDLTYPTYLGGLKLYFFIDVNEGQLFFEGEQGVGIVKPELLDAIMKGSIISQLTQSLNEKISLTNLMNIGLGLAVGGLIGYIIGGLF